MRLLQILRRPPLLFLLLLFTHGLLRDGPLHAGERFVVRPISQSRPRILSGLTEKHIQRPKVGLILSGGGARGAAQIGVLKVLEQSGIPTVMIVFNEETEKVKHDATIYGVPRQRFVVASRFSPGGVSEANKILEPVLDFSHGEKHPGVSHLSRCPNLTATCSDLA